MNIIVIILMFGLLVFVHEFGHFLFAKLNHIGVAEFSIGMGPAVAKWGQGETRYYLRALPIGGYVMMEGMNEDSDKANAFQKKSILARLSVLLAGPFFNFLLAFFLSIIICHNYGLDPTVLASVDEKSAAYEAGLREGDEILKINGHRVYLFREISLFRMTADPEKPIDIVYKRDGKQQETTAKMTYNEEYGQYMLGISGGYAESKNVWQDVKFSYYEIRLQIKSTIASVKMLVTGKVGKDALMGPVGIGNAMNDVIDQAEQTAEVQHKNKSETFWLVFLNIINFTVLISANLGVMNLLPIPALDGGRILFVLIEAIAGKPVPKDKENLVTGVGVILLLILVVFVWFNDISNVFK